MSSQKEKLIEYEGEIVRLTLANTMLRKQVSAARNVTIKYRGYTIQFNPKPIPDFRFDWDWVHDDYEGEGDSRCGSSPSLADAKEEVDECIECSEDLTESGKTL